MADQNRRFRLEWWVVGVFLLLVATTIVGALQREFVRTTEQEQDRLEVQARVVDNNLIRQLEGMQHALAGVAEGWTPAAPADATTRQLKLLASAMPGVRTMAIIDAGGTVISTSRDALAGQQIMHRDFFEAARQQPSSRMLRVSAPFRSSLGGEVIVVARGLTGSAGEFAGVVAATLDPDYFGVLLRSVLYAPDMRSAIVHPGGKVFVGQVAGATDERMTATRTVVRAQMPMDKPLVAVLSRDRSAVYELWRTKVWRFGAFAAIVGLMVAGGLYFSQRQRRVLDRLAAEAAAQRQQSTDRFELALRGADLGLWDVHGPSGKVIANVRERVMLGFDPEQPLPDGFSWQKLIHPDDRPAVKTAIEAHVRGDTEAYECEHRMRHCEGHWIWVFSRGIVAERDAAGRPVRMVGTHLDITHSKLADAELARTSELLRRSEEQLRQVTDNLPVLVSSLDLERRFCFANRTYFDWFGFDPASLLGRSLAEVYGEATYAAIRHHIDAAMGGATTVYERKMPVPGGVRHVEVTLVPQRGDDGSVRGLHSLIFDLTARQEAEAQRVRSEERLSLALEGSGLALFDWDIPGNRLYQSAQAAVMRGDPPTDEAASPSEFQSFVHPDDLDLMLAHINDALTGRTPVYHAEFRIRKRSGAWLWVRARGRVVERDGAGRALRLAGTYADINARKVSEARLRHLAEFDTLTDLPNRAQFMERLQSAMARATAASPMALLFLDIDHFKTINDTLGHEAGDRLLKVFAQRMRASVRQSDMAARLAGDEFTIVLEGVRDGDDAKGVAQKLVEALREPIVLAGRCFEITASIGIAMSVGGETDDAALLRRADAALYEAKRRGRNGWFGDDEGEAAGGRLAA